MRNPATGMSRKVLAAVTGASVLALAPRAAEATPGNAGGGPPAAGRMASIMRWLLCLSLPALLLAGGAGMARAEGPPVCQTDCATAIVPPVAASPFGITRGPLGSVWFSLGNAIGRVDQQDQVTTYPVPTANADVGWMAADPESSVWFAERGSGKIGRITPDGAITEYPLPTPTAVPMGMVFAPDGTIYVTEQGANAIARLDPTTGQATDIPVPTPNSTTQSGALGPDGAIWFIERSAAKIGRMTLDGTFTEYPLAPGAFPNRIVAGPDGALWFTELRAGKIGRITTTGTLTEYPIAGGPVGITIGRDRQLYVDLSNAGAVARASLDGQVTGQWPLPDATLTLQVTTGFGLDIWVTDTFGGKAYRVTPYALGQ
jgi:streptogramin lyase